MRFEGFRLDVPGGVLMRGGKRLALRRQPFRVLAYLAEHPGRLISNKELIDKCWDNPRHTSVNSLAQCIKAIREALGETDHEIIRTVHGQGYVFASPVSTVLGSQPQVLSTPRPTTQGPAPAQPPAVQPRAEPIASAPDATHAGGPSAEALRLLRRAAHRLLRRKGQALAAGLVVVAVLLGGAWLWSWAARPVELAMMATPTIAVLPMKAIGGEPDRSDVAGALTGEIETELSRIPRGFDMRVRLAPGYKGPIEPPRAAGRELGVRYLALGSIRRDSDGRHLNMQLIEAESGRAVWAEPFVYDPGDPKAQSRVAIGIARMLLAQILRAESRRPLPARPEAGHYVILGRAHMTGERAMAASKAMAYFDKARALDPDSVPALQGGARVRVNNVLNRWQPKEEWGRLLDEAEDAIKRAMTLEGADAGMHVLRGAYLRARNKDAEAIKAFERALELYPNYPLALAELGRAKIEVGLAHETVGHIREAMSVSPKEPFGTVWYYWAGMAEAHLGRYQSAKDWLLQARNANRSYPNIVPWLALAHAGLDEWDEARAYMAEHRKVFPKFSMAGWRLAMPQLHQDVIPQRQRLEALLRQLGVPERPPPRDKVQTGLAHPGGKPQATRAAGQ
jgi:DNA-binding winged helix-turn-helix (wHTH) protein/TolB-like protein